MIIKDRQGQELPVKETRMPYYRETEETSDTGNIDNVLACLGIGDKISGDSVIFPDVITELLVETENSNRDIERFKKQLDAEIFNVAESYGGIIRVTQLNNSSVSILIMLEPGKVDDLMMRLSILPGVETDDSDPLSAAGIRGNGRSPVNHTPVVKVSVAGSNRTTTDKDLNCM